MTVRSKHRNPWILFSLSAFVVLMMTVLSMFLFGPSVPTRIGVAVVGDPVVIFSYDWVRRGLVIIKVPHDVSVDMVRGYGKYPVGSVFQLDELDKRDGRVFMETMEEAVGIPVRFYIHPTKSVPQDSSPLDIVLHAVSYPSLFWTTISPKRTNIPINIFFELTRAFPSLRPTEMKIFDLEALSVFTEVTLPDGSRVKEIDQGKLGYHLGTHGEDGQIRSENSRIAVLNTTKTPGLAQKAARVLEKTGFHVITIANSDQESPKQCIVRMKKDFLESVTVKTLVYLYHCQKEVETEVTQHDATLILGSDFEKRFYPY